LFDHDVGGKDDRMGRVAIDLRQLSKEVSHHLWRQIKDGEGMLNVIITISGTTKTDSPSNLSNWNPDPQHPQQLEENYVRKKIINKIQKHETFALANCKHILQDEGYWSSNCQGYQSSGTAFC
jgi:hypothetical protein